MMSRETEYCEGIKITLFSLHSYCLISSNVHHHEFLNLPFVFSSTSLNFVLTLFLFILFLLLVLYSFLFLFYSSFANIQSIKIQAHINLTSNTNGNYYSSPSRSINTNSRISTYYLFIIYFIIYIYNHIRNCHYHKFLYHKQRQKFSSIIYF